jgi:hypothetical protein
MLNGSRDQTTEESMTHDIFFENLEGFVEGEKEFEDGDCGHIKMIFYLIYEEPRRSAMSFAVSRSSKSVDQSLSRYDRRKHGSR